MGLIKAIAGATGGVLADQWKEYIYCESQPADVLVSKGQKRVGGRSSNTSGEDNVISNGSVVAVNDGQCLIIVENGKVVDICAEPGEYRYDTSLAPSVFTGNSLSESVGQVFNQIGKRFTFGGDPGQDQRVYFVNTKEIIGNKYGTPNSIAFKVVDPDINFKLTMSLRCFGEYSYRITNPILFYTNICGNVEREYTRDEIDSQLKSELLTALQPAFAKLSAMRIEYDEILAHTMELADSLNEVLSKKWSEYRGIEIVNFGINSIKASDEDEAKLKEYQSRATLTNPNMRAAYMAGGMTEAMENAAMNESTGPAMAFMGMNMAQNAGMMGMNMGANNFGMGQQPVQPQPQAPAPVVLLIQASSALSAAALSQQTQKAGPAAAVLLTRASSALNVVQKNQQVLRFISAISAAGSQRIRTIRQNSVQNVVTHLMIMILSEHNRGLLVQYF